MALEMIRLQWQVDSEGYAIREEKATPESSLMITGIRTGEYLVPKSGKLTNYSASLGECNVIDDLISTPQTRDGALTFTNKWGLLHPMNDKLAEFFWRSTEARESYELASKEGISKLFHPTRFGSLKIGFEQGSGQSAPRVFFYADSLLTFCWLELLQAVAGGVDLLVCERCSKPFRRARFGPKSRTCSKACHQALWRKSKKARN